MRQPEQKLFLEYGRHTLDRIESFRKTEYNSRLQLILFLLKSISSLSILLASGWVVLVSSHIVALSIKILEACGVHIVVVALSVLTTFALILAHTWSKCMFEETEAHWQNIYATSLVAKDLGSGQENPAQANLQSLHDAFIAAQPTIIEKWNKKIMNINRTAWSFGITGVTVFVLSIGWDVHVGLSVIAANSLNTTNSTAKSNNGIEPTALPIRAIAVNNYLHRKKRSNK